MRALNEQSIAELEPYGALAELLRQRAVEKGSILVLTDALGRSPPRRHGPAAGTDSFVLPPFEYTRAVHGDAEAVLARGRFEAVAVSMGSADPTDVFAILETLAASLAPNTALALIQPARGGRGDRQAIHSLLRRSGFDRIWVENRRGWLRVTARRASAGLRPKKCSIIVPVYNERETFPVLMRALLARRLDHLGLEREIIVVESNSTDGTRELVSGFAAAPGVKLLWQEHPRGKGHAVREGLGAATGDIVLIQDADLEYDLDDYDALLRPLLEDRVDFVLGSRHTGVSRMRKFTDQRLLGDLCNAAHLCFATVINVLYRQRLKDPFTMFKVFRRECLYGLEFECDRFDFDHELLIKLLLKGYVPLEVPVSYCSRSFKQGKKIRFFRDPPTWLRADLRYRLRRLEPRFAAPSGAPGSERTVVVPERPTFAAR